MDLGDDVFIILGVPAVWDNTTLFLTYLIFMNSELIINIPSAVIWR